MTLDFWAAVRVDSGIMVFSQDFYGEANLFHKNTAESSGTAGDRFVFSKLMSRGVDPLPLVPELAKWSGRGGECEGRGGIGVRFDRLNELGMGKSLRLSKGACPPRLLGNHRSAWFYGHTNREQGIHREVPLHGSHCSAKETCETEAMAAPPAGRGATACVHCLVVRTTPPMTHAVPTICTSVTRSPRKTAAETMTRIGMRFMKTAARCGVTRVRAW